MSKKNTIILFTLSVLFFSLSLVGVYVYGAVSGVFHTPDEIKPGSFQNGNYTFPGNVGIGTTSPSYKLQVSGTGYFNNVGVSGGLTVGTGADNEWRGLYLLGDNHWLINAHNGDGTSDRNGAFVIRKCSSYSGDTCNKWNNWYFTITSSGNVGIGTTGPAAKLDVNGRIRMKDSGGQAGVIEMDCNGTSCYAVYAP